MQFRGAANPTAKSARDCRLFPLPDGEIACTTLHPPVVLCCTAGTDGEHIETNNLPAESDGLVPAMWPLIFLSRSVAMVTCGQYLNIPEIGVEMELTAVRLATRMGSHKTNVAGEEGMRCVQGKWMAVDLVFYPEVVL